MDGRALEKIVDFAYTGEIELAGSTVVSIIRAANVIGEGATNRVCAGEKNRGNIHENFCNSDCPPRVNLLHCAKFRSCRISRTEAPHGMRPGVQNRKMYVEFCRIIHRT